MTQVTAYLLFMQLNTRCRSPCFFDIIEQMPKPNYLGEFELLVMLTVLRLGDSAYGVPISREIERQTGRNVAFGTVYSTLERLEEKGFVCSSLGDATRERGGRAKPPETNASRSCWSGCSTPSA